MPIRPVGGEGMTVSFFRHPFRRKQIIVTTRDSQLMSISMTACLIEKRRKLS